MKKLLLFALSIVLFSCSSDSDSDGGGSDSGFAYIKGKLDGQTFNYTFNNSMSDTHFFSYINSTSSDGINDVYSYGGMMYPMTFSPSMMIAWDSMVSTPDPSQESGMFYGAFDDVAENYLNETQYNDDVRGIDVQYEDAEGNFYNTIYGSQSGSSFNVTSMTEGMDGGLKTITMVGTFSCKLYNSDNAADVKNFTNGKFKLIVREDN